MAKKPYDKSLMRQAKMELIDRAFDKYGVRSFADLGGVWRVEGGYSFYAASEHKAEHSYLVDTHPTERVRELSKKWPVEIVQGSFGDPSVAEKVKGVDAVFLFDVLLHQVAPDWDDILRLYSSTPVLVIYNQQWTGPNTVRLLDLGEEEYYRNTPYNQDERRRSGLFRRLDTPHPDHGGRLWRDVHHIWQWGITDLDLIRAATALGYKLEYFENYGRFQKLPQFENHGMIFTKRN